MLDTIVLQKRLIIDTIKNQPINMVKIFLVFTILYSFNVKAQINTIEDLILRPSFHQEIHDLWKDRRASIENQVNLSKENAYTLYNIQIFTHSLLRYAFRNEDTTLIEELLTVYSGTLGTMNYTNQYLFSHFGTVNNLSQHTLDTYYSMWAAGEKDKPEQEHILASSQFLALISEAVLEISKINISKRTPIMTNFVHDFVPILESHYHRWVVGIEVEGLKNTGPFQRKGEGCKVGGVFTPAQLTQIELIDLLIDENVGDNKPHCNTMSDIELWITSGVSNYLTSYFIDDDLITTPRDLDILKSYLTSANLLMEAKLTTTKLTDFSGDSVEGVVFDSGSWDEHSDYAYTAYTDDSFPTEGDKKHNKNMGWDISHGRRFIFAFENLYKNKKVLGYTFPSTEVMVKLSNQFIYGVFNKDFKYPLFSNFMDGSDGWYRVNWNKREGFGYPPSILSSSILSGGYGMYQHYNSKVNLVMKSLYNMLNSPDDDIRDFVVKNYENQYFKDYKLNHNLNFKEPNGLSKHILLEFYASLSKKNKIEEIDTIFVYPNPVVDILTLSTLEDVKEYILYNALGQLIMHSQFPVSNQINVSFLSNGFYFLVVVSNTKRLSIKFIKK